MTRSGLPVEARVQERGEGKIHGVEAVDGDPARERADDATIAQVDADVHPAVVGDDVAGAAVGPAREATREEVLGR